VVSKFQVSRNCFEFLICIPLGMHRSVENLWQAPVIARGQQPFFKALLLRRALYSGVIRYSTERPIPLGWAKHLFDYRSFIKNSKQFQKLPAVQ
jgi:hypothetical protein